MQILIYLIDDQQYGIPLEKVKTALLAVETTPIPNAPDYILGAINVRGEIVPVISMRKVLKLPCRELKSSDQFILCTFQGKSMAICIDAIKEIKLFKKEELLSAEELFPHMEGLKHVIKDGDQITLIYDEIAI